MRAALIALLLITTGAALAQSEPKLIEGSVPVLDIPQLKPEADEATKIWALKRALIINGNSMVRWSSLDLTSEAASAKIKTERIALPPAPKNKPKPCLGASCPKLEVPESKTVSILPLVWICTSAGCGPSSTRPASWLSEK
jgi:hypothetical protein